MNSVSDHQLLREYLDHQSETAFGEVVSRHIDFVYSAALRLVHDRHLAEDVTQATFIALAKHARQLTAHPVLSGWLHCTTRNLATKTVRADVRRRAREEEAAAMNQLLSTEPDPLWEQIAPHLDDALSNLEESDRDALLLRYFERKSAREMAEILNTSETAAQKRVTRAVERLRKFFSKRRVTIGASGLVVLISANAVQSAPVTLTTSVSGAAVLTGTAAAACTSAAITATKTIAMTALQKTIVAATLAVVAGTGIYEAHQASQLSRQNETLLQQQAPLAAQIRHLKQEHDNATNRLASLADQLEKTTNNNLELFRLRGQVTLLQSELMKQTAAKVAPVDDTSTNDEPSYKHDLALLTHYFETNPSQQIPEMKLLPKEYIQATYGLAVQIAARNNPANYGKRGVFDENRIKLETDEEYRAAASELRNLAEAAAAPKFAAALKEYLQANNGAYPKSISELQAFFSSPIDPAILQRYEIEPASDFSKIQAKYSPKSRTEGFVITQTAPIDEEFDHRLIIDPTSFMDGGPGSFKP